VITAGMTRPTTGMETLVSVKAGLAVLRSHLMAQLDLVDALDAETDVVASVVSLHD
jgi:hypothetical protein